MNKGKTILSGFPILFLVFLSSFIISKTIFIIFFNTPYEPAFLLHLSPLYLLKSSTELQMLIASLSLTVINLYLHIRVDIKRVYSIVTTLIMLSSLSLSIIDSNISIDMAVEYSVFLFILILLISDIKAYIIPEKSFYSWIIRRDHSGFEKGKVVYQSERTVPHRVVSDLVLIDDIDANYIKILNNIGIKNVDDLADINAEELVKSFKKYMKELEETITNLSEDKVVGWIERAKSLINERERFRNV